MTSPNWDKRHDTPGKDRNRDGSGGRKNQDDLSRKAGCYLYADTRLWLDANIVHRGDGPAVIFPDGVERWYIRGRERTRDVKVFFYEKKWPVEKGLDTPEKIAAFAAHFLG